MRVRVFEGSLTKLTPFGKPYSYGNRSRSNNPDVIQSSNLGLDKISAIIKQSKLISGICHILPYELNGDNYEIIWPE